MVNNTERVLLANDNVRSVAALRYIRVCQEGYMYTIFNYSNYKIIPSGTLLSVWEFPNWAWYNE